jgi:hypothetical protein
MNPQFHRVAEGCVFLQRHLRAGYHAHVEEVLSQRSFTSHFEDGGRLSFMEFSESHCSFVSNHSLCKDTKKEAHSKQLHTSK